MPPVAQSSGAGAGRPAPAEASRPETGADEYKKGWVWNTRKDFKGWKYLEGERDERRSAKAKARRADKRAHRIAQQSAHWDNWQEWEEAWRDRPAETQNLDPVEEDEEVEVEEEDAANFASARSESGSDSSSYSESDSSDSDRPPAAAPSAVRTEEVSTSDQTVPPQAAATAGSAHDAEEGQADAETLSALKLQVRRALESNGGKDLEAALAANPRKENTAEAAAEAAEATSPTVMQSPSQQGNETPTSPAAEAETQKETELVQPKREPAALIRIFSDGSFDVVNPKNPDVPVPLEQEERDDCMAIARKAADQFLQAQERVEKETIAEATPAAAAQQEEGVKAETASAANDGTAAAAEPPTAKESPKPADTSAQAAMNREAGDAPARASTARMEVKQEGDEETTMLTAADTAEAEESAEEAENRGRPQKRRKRHRHKKPKSL